MPKLAQLFFSFSIFPIISIGQSANPASASAPQANAQSQTPSPSDGSNQTRKDKAANISRGNPTAGKGSASAVTNSGQQSASTLQSASTPANSAQPAEIPLPSKAATLPLTLTVNPSSVFAGEKYTLTIQAIGTSCVDTTDLPSVTDTVSASSPNDVTAEAPQKINGRPCELIVPITVSQDAIEGTLNLFLRGKSTENLATIPLKILPMRSKAPGPIPPGISAQTDLTWKVLPRKPVADRYGERVANHFFAIEATIGNNTGYDLQIAALAFNLQSENSPNSDANPVAPRVFDSPPSPTDAYPIVRGTVEREQSVGTRAIVINLVRAAAPILTGVGAFYVGGMSQNYLLSANIFSGPFEKGLELVYPDLTTNHLVNLDNNTLRDSTVISNNQQVRVNAFISRELVECGFVSHIYTLHHVPSKANCQSSTDKRLPFAYEYDPMEIKARLGDLVLYGRPIYYLSRVRVVAGTEPDLRTVITATVPQQTIVVTTKQSHDESIAGLHLAGSVIIADPPLMVKNQKVSADGSAITFSLDASQVEKAGNYTLKVVNDHGSSQVDVQVVDASGDSSNTQKPSTPVKTTPSKKPSASQKPSPIVPK